MPRSKTTKSKAAPERRNAPKGSTVKPQLVYHTAGSKAALESLGAKWGETNANEVVRRALAETDARE